MQDGVSVSVAFTTEDYVRVLQFMQGGQFLRKYGFIIVFVVVFVGLLTFILYLGRDSDGLSLPLSVLTAFIPAILGGGFAFVIDRLLSPFLLRRSIAKQFKSSRTLGDTYQITINGSGISTSSEVSSSTLGWDAFLRGVETETDFLFYTTPKFSNFIPKSKFLCEDDVECVRRLARSKLGERAEF